MKKTLVIATVIVLIVAFAFAASWYRGTEAERVETIADESTTVLVPNHAMTLGPKDAKVTLVEFFDPACETCAAFHAPVKEPLGSHPDPVLSEYSAGSSVHRSGAHVELPIRGQTATNF